jgi:hypothetical protein
MGGNGFSSSNTRPGSPAKVLSCYGAEQPQPPTPRFQTARGWSLVTVVSGRIPGHDQGHQGGHRSRWSAGVFLGVAKVFLDTGAVTGHAGQLGVFCAWPGCPV